jgi:hypothetical protein
MEIINFDGDRRASKTKLLRELLLRFREEVVYVLN